MYNSELDKQGWIHYTTGVRDGEMICGVDKGNIQRRPFPAR